MTTNPATLLRALRNERGLSLEYLAGEASLTTVALSNIELKSAKPQSKTLFNILNILDKASPISLADRLAILGAFGYADTPELPHSVDIERAVAAWKEPFREAGYPAYLVDFSQRIHDWNSQALALTGLSSSDAEGLTVFDIMFSKRFQGNLTVLNRQELLSKTVLQMWQEYQPYAGQPWCENCIREARATYPEFGKLYDSFSGNAAVPVDLRIISPVVLADPSGTRLTFKIIGVDLVSDPRFRAVQYVPADTQTMHVLSAA